MQVLKNIYQVGGDLNGITYDGKDAGYNDSNTYIIKRDEGLIMIDTGCGDTLEQIFANMKYWSLNPDDIKYCILTHPHFDHAAGGSTLKNFGVKFISISETADAVSKGDDRTCPYLYHKTFTSFEVDKIVSDKEKFELFGIVFEVMHLPGHSMGCTAYFFNYEDKRIVISGDIIGTLLDGYHGWNGSIDFDKEKYLKSLLKFSKIDTDIMLPGHGMIYFHKPRKRVEEVLNMALIEWR
jgi:glyoxylase-like metal-dependent hydrolase (beta-lactamase superfamily II)